jgi:hypothetical protein
LLARFVFGDDVRSWPYSFGVQTRGELGSDSPPLALLALLLRVVETTPIFTIGLCDRDRSAPGDCASSAGLMSSPGILERSARARRRRRRTQLGGARRAPRNARRGRDGARAAGSAWVGTGARVKHARTRWQVAPAWRQEDDSADNTRLAHSNLKFQSPSARRRRLAVAVANVAAYRSPRILASRAAQGRRVVNYQFHLRFSRMNFAAVLYLEENNLMHTSTIRLFFNEAVIPKLASV